MSIINEVVLFSRTTGGLKSNIGLLVNPVKGDAKSGVIELSSSGCYAFSIERDDIGSINNISLIREDIKRHYSERISELEGMLTKITEEEKVEEKAKRYNELKLLIIKNSSKLKDCDDVEFENRLKEINKLKKLLYAIDLTGADVIRKQNGTIKYKISQLQKEMDTTLNKISDENINKLLEKFL